MTTKEKVLEILTASKGKSISGEELALSCNVSRAAIWKAVNALREKGCLIEGTTNGGYILSGEPDLFSTEAFFDTFSKAFPDFQNSHIECFNEIDSTNTYAKRLLSDCGALRTPEGTLTEAGKKYHNSIYVAECQTAGRGRLGRTFYSPAKTGIYLSIIYAPKNGITDPALITAFSAVAICRVLNRLYNIQPGIKWINDIFINNKKVCGILTEGFMNFETARIESAIIGIGINIKDNPDVFPEAVKKVAGAIISKNDSSSTNVTRTELAANIAGEVLKVLEENPEQLIKEYKASSFLLGTTVTVHPIIDDKNSVYTAKAVDIDEKAGLIVELIDGTKKTLSSGEVSLHSESL